MSVPSDRLRKDPTRHVKERVIEAVLLMAACVSVFTTTAIVYILVKESWVFFQHVPLTDFLFDTQWTPLFDDAHYGIMVLLSGTITSSAVALLVAIPLGTVIAIYLSAFAPFGVREIAKPFLELLGQFGRDLRGVALDEMLHQPFGNVGLAVVHRAFAEVDVEPVGEVFEQPDAFGVDASCG